MAYRFNASGEYLASGAGLPAENLLTAAWWMKITVDNNAQVRVFTVSNNIGTVTNSVVLSSADGTTIALRTASTQQDGTNLTVGQWYHVAYVCDGNDRRLYLDGVLDASHTVANSFTTGFIALSWPTGTQYLDGNVEGFKLWDAVLSQSEIQAEMATLRPVRTANLNRWTPMFLNSSRAEDFSSNDYDWTENGTLTFETGSGTPFDLLAAGAFTLTGSAAGLRVARKLTAAAGSYALTGQTAGLRAARKLIAAAASYALTGSDVTLTYEPVTAYTLVAEAGAFVLTGQAAGLRVARKLAANAGAYTLTGGAAALRRDAKLAAAAGAFTLTGGAAGLVAARRIEADPGSFALNGGDATLTYARAGVLLAEPAAYTLTGGDADLIYTPVSRPAQGGGFASVGARRWYIFKGQKLLLTQGELAQLVALELGRISRQDVKVAPKGRKPHVIAKQAWQEVQASINRLELLRDPEPEPVKVYIDDDDEEMALALLV